MSTTAKAPAPEPLPSEADTLAFFTAHEEAEKVRKRVFLETYSHYDAGEAFNKTGAKLLAAHVATQTAELRAILERTQEDLHRMTDKANALVGARIAMERTQAELADARNDAAWQRAKRNKRKAAK